MNSPSPEDKLSAIKEALFAGQKIDAIKLHRETTGSGLLEAKTVIEKLDADLRATSPEKFVAPKASGGCLGVLATFVAFIGLLLWRLNQ